jgi:hypothetical protein
MLEKQLREAIAKVEEAIELLSRMRRYQMVVALQEAPVRIMEVRGG